MMKRSFKQVDVFTEIPFKGNPVAVVLEAEGLSTEEMQAIANWTNLSETTFVLPSEVADYRLRIFHPRGELPFAGHPTIGSAFAVREAGLVKKSSFTQECHAGLISLTVDENDVIFLEVPSATLAAEIDENKIARALGVTSSSFRARPLPITLGPTWLIVALDSLKSLRGLEPDMAVVTELSHIYNLTGFTVYAQEPNQGLYARSFAPAVGITEDPVCGSGNAAIAVYRDRVLGENLSDYTAYQGEALGRAGQVQIKLKSNGDNSQKIIYLGGRAVTVIEGQLVT